MRAVLLIIVSLCIAGPFSASASELNAGFVQGFWYSNEALFADTQVRMYVALRNNTESELSGTVVFNDNGTTIISKNVQALAGRLVEAWADWTPMYGTHTLSATIESVTLYAVGKAPTTTTVSNALAEDTVFVDYDTDRDGVGNKKDTDDDGDGVSDKTEIANGTDPLVYDTPLPEKKIVPETLSATSTNASQSDSAKETAASEPQGLEQLVNAGKIDTAFAQVTETINTTKQALDDYRDARKEKVTQNSPALSSDSSEIAKSLESVTRVARGVTTTPQDVATITRSRIETGPSFTKRSIDAGLFIISSIYTILLNLLSFILGFPALVELALLILILLIVYHLARKLGRRPID